MPERWTTPGFLITVATGLVLLAFAPLITGCGGKRQVLGEQKVVGVSGKKGAWVEGREDYFERKGELYFRGTATRVRDLTLGRRQAEADARKRIAESIASRVRTEYEDHARGANLGPYDVMRFVEDAVVSSSEGIDVSGVMPHESYWVKIRTTTHEGAQFTYDCYVLLRIARSDYERARLMAVTRVLDRARAESVKAAEEGFLERRGNSRPAGMP